MKWNKAQKEVFNALLSKSDVRKIPQDNETTLVVINGIKGYVFPNSIINFNVSKMKQVELEINSIVADCNELKITEDCRYDANSRKIMIRLTNGHWNEFVNMKFLEVYDNPKFYQLSARRAIVITELGNVVGIVMPCLVKNAELLYTDMEKWRLS